MNISTYMATGAMGSPRRRGPGPAWDSKQEKADNWSVVGFLVGFIVLPVIAIGFLIWATLTAPDAKGDSTLLPTTPPALPTYIVKDDGTRVSCGPNYRWCWENQQP
jgi:hypothetical protein